MIEIIPFEPWHARQLIPQKQQSGERFSPPESGEAFTGTLGQKVLFCVGRAHGFGAWALLSKDAGPHMVAITRIFRRLLVLNGSDPLEALIKPDFPQAHRLMKMLGFGKSGMDKETGYDVYVREWRPALVAAVEKAVMDGHGVECPTTHEFTDGTYLRRMFIPAGTVIVGKAHLVETLNICAKGDISILTAKGPKRFAAGDVAVSEAGIQKIGFAHEDTVWVNVFSNPTNERDIGKLEKMFARDPIAPVDVDKFMQLALEEK